MVPAAFVNHACEILGDTSSGLSGPKIVKYLNAYAFEYDANIPYPDYPFPQSVPNKRTALRKNLRAFSHEQQVQILNEFCRRRPGPHHPAVREGI